MSHSASPASGIALDDGHHLWTFAELRRETDQLAARLEADGVRVLATVMDNSPAWVIVDRAAARAGLVHVPLPAFFSPNQMLHALQAAGVDALLGPSALVSHWPEAPSMSCVIAHQTLTMLRLPGRRVSMPSGTVKITFTSGTTGSPKGVCLDEAAIERVAAGLVQATAMLDIRRHLCTLPLAVLLEDIAGVTAPLLRGATCITLPLRSLGLSGSSTFDPARFHATVIEQRPNSIILLPQMLRAWVSHLIRCGERGPDSLSLVAVGGASVGAKLIEAARALGIPAYEGYGLSEGASVQTLNLPANDRPGSAGWPLPHAKVRIAADGEVEVAGSLFGGYLGDSRQVPSWWPTGDLGRIDADGFLHVQGRKKHVLITSFGRNISPEWVETTLRSESAVAQAVVFGDGEPNLSAVLWPVDHDATHVALQAAVDGANAQLPDYARIHRWTRGRAAFTAEAGMATSNGRPQREAILRRHAGAIGLAEPSFSNPESR